MSRCKKRVQREIKPDPVYGSVMISRFINAIMEDGKKEVAEKIVYSALKMSGEKIIDDKCKSVAEAFEKIIMSLGPTVQTKTRRVGGTNYQVPVELPDYKIIFLGMKLLKKAARSKKGMSMEKALAQEISDAHESRGEAFKEKASIQRQALANKAYAHLA